jgi:hypothetical protein
LYVVIFHACVPHFHPTDSTFPVLSAGIVAVILNLILPDNELIPKDQVQLVQPDEDVEAQPVMHQTEHEHTKGDGESLTSSDKKRDAM